MNFKHRAFILFFLFLMTFSVSNVLAEDDLLELPDIINLALQKNIDLKLAELDLEEAKINYQESKLQNLLTNSKLQSLTAELQLLLAEENYRNQQDGIVMEIVNDYLEIVKLEEEIKTLEEEVELEKSKVIEVKAQKEVGIKGQLDLFEQQTKYQDVLDNLEMARDKQRYQLQVLKEKSGLEQNMELKIWFPTRVEIWQVDEEQALKLALENSSSLLIYEKKVAVAEAEWERSKIVENSKLDLKQKELALEKARLEFLREQQKLENSIQSKFHQYKQAIKNLKMAEQRKIYAEEQLKVMGEQYTTGLVSKNDLLTARVNQLKAKDSYIGAIINYYLSKLSLQQAMGLELEVRLDSE